jgi:GAF domain-containing protein
VTPEGSDPLLARIARLANELGPALAPASHVELLEAITAAAKELFGAAACSLALLTDDRTELVFHVASGEGATDVVGVRMPADRGIAGWVISSGQPIAIEDLSDDPRFARDVAETTGFIPTSILAMPLETERGMLGVISVLDRSNERGSDMDVLALFARQAALAIESGRVFADLGAALFGALEQASDDDDLTALLQRSAQGAAGSERKLGEIAAVMNALAEAGPEERDLAVDVLRRFLDYARARW